MDVLGVKEHRRWIVRSANAAAKAADFILNRMPAEPGTRARACGLREINKAPLINMRGLFLLQL